MSAGHRIYNIVVNIPDICHALKAKDFQMMVTGRQKLFTILFMVFIGNILIYKARRFDSEKVYYFQTSFN